MLYGPSKIATRLRSGGPVFKICEAFIARHVARHVLRTCAEATIGQGSAVVALVGTHRGPVALYPVLPPVPYSPNSSNYVLPGSGTAPDTILCTSSRRQSNVASALCCPFCSRLHNDRDCDVTPPGPGTPNIIPSGGMPIHVLLGQGYPRQHALEWQQRLPCTEGNRAT